jgi:Family of unknown function (DUF5683)
MSVRGWSCVVAILVLAWGVAPARAQVADSARIGVRTPRRQPAPPDSARRLRDSLSRPPISPKRALLLSLLVPGWGQAKLNRAVAGGIYVASEFTSIAMLIQSKRQLNEARRAARDVIYDPATGADTANPLAARIKSRRRQVEDWKTLLIFTHLFAAADAFVAAHLWNVPEEVGTQSDGRRFQLQAKVSW